MSLDPRKLCAGFTELRVQASEPARTQRNPPLHFRTRYKLLKYLEGEEFEILVKLPFFLRRHNIRDILVPRPSITANN